MELDIIQTKTTWNDAAKSINNNYAKIADAIAQLKVNSGGGGGGADIDLTDYATKVWVKSQSYITADALIPYAKSSDLSAYLPIAGGTMEGALTMASELLMDAHILPTTTNYYDIGSSALKFQRIYANYFYGNLSGTATSATTASRLSVGGIFPTTKYGNYAGILQTSGTTNATVPQEGVMFNILRIFRNVSTGYYTDLAQSLDGEEGLYYRRMQAGTISEWKRVACEDDLKGYLLKDVADTTYLGIEATAADADKLGGQLPSYYATSDDLTALSNLFNKMFEFDSENNAIKAKLSLYSEGGITAGGVGSAGGGGTSGGGGISEITSEMVVSALGYTPYNASNPSGYITVAALTPYLKAKEAQETYATINSVTAIHNTLIGQIGVLTERVGSVETLAQNTNNALTNYALKSEIPTSLPASDVYDWAKASVKPTYSASEVGALGIYKADADTNLDTLQSAGVYSLGASGNTPARGYANLFVAKGGRNTFFQLLGNYQDNNLYYRGSDGNKFTEWQSIAFTSQIPTQLSQLTDDVVAGNYLPIGGTAVRANTISLNGISANTTYGEYAGIIQSPTGGAEEGAWHNSLRILHNNSSGYYTEICQNFTGTDALYYRRMENGSLSAWHRVLDERGGYINENAYLKFTSIDGQGGKFGYYKMDNPTLGNYVEFFNDSSKVGIHLHDNGEIYTYRGGRYTNVDSGNISNYTAGAALKLAHSHTLWGRSFDGTDDVTGSLSGVVDIIASGNITADSITIGGITLSVVNGALKIAGSAYTTGAFTVGA